MDEQPPPFETVFTTRQRHECFEFRLVLDAVGIPSEALHRDGFWTLMVKREDAAAAAEELTEYRRENSGRRVDDSTAVPVYGGATAAVIGYAGVIILVATLAVRRALGVDWLAVGQMHAGSVVAGEWWRAVTALTLHLDAEHLVGNLVFGGLFGFLAGRVLGGGVAWLVVIVAGALGNFANAWIQASAHTSIGASTAVFAALGVIVSHASRPRTPVQQKAFKRWSPLIAGIVLFSMTGLGGERTDVAAHVTGFVAGLGIGWAGCRVPDRWLAAPGVQVVAGLAAITIIACAWSLGLRLSSAAD